MAAGRAAWSSSVAKVVTELAFFTGAINSLPSAFRRPACFGRRLIWVHLPGERSSLRGGEFEHQDFSARARAQNKIGESTKTKSNRERGERKERKRKRASVLASERQKPKGKPKAQCLVRNLVKIS